MLIIYVLSTKYSEDLINPSYSCLIDLKVYNFGKLIEGGLMGTQYEEFLNKGILEREKGDVEVAVAYLNKALSLSETKEEKVNARNHLGLAYFHQGDFVRAKGQWMCVYECTEDNLSDRAVALRNLSRKELYPTVEGLSTAQKYSEDALRLAELSNRKDIVWFVHGLFSSTRAVGKKKALKKVLKREAKEFFKVWRHVPKLERAVWFDGLIMDFVITYGKVTKPFLNLAKLIARSQKLKRREEQINKLINELS